MSDVKAPLLQSQNVICLLREKEPGCLHIDEIAHRTGFPHYQVARTCRRLASSQLLTLSKVTRARFDLTLTLTQAGRDCDLASLRPAPKPPQRQIRKPRHNTLREQFWRLLRLRQKLSIPEALEVLLTPGDDVARATATLQQYLRGLAKGGYITLLKARLPGNGPRSSGHKRWLLIDDTGRIAPSLSAKWGIYDHNLQKARP